MACASVQLAIPHDPAMESLNVAASAAVCLFEQLRQTNYKK
jgi:TrmH family RNA methyltransferase